MKRYKQYNTQLYRLYSYTDSLWNWIYSILNDDVCSVYNLLCKLFKSVYQSLHSLVACFVLYTAS